MTIELPSKKTAPSLDPARAKVFVYGHPKVGKTTLAANLDPDRTLFAACEPGLGALSAFQVPIKSWTEFRELGAKIDAEPDRFSTVVIDTVDELLRFCVDQVKADLKIAHPSDLDYGKGWAAVNDEFRLRIGKLASLGVGVWFIAHARDEEIKTPTGSITKTVPTISGGARKWLTGFADFILLAAVEYGDDGEQRVLRTAASESYEAGGRVQLPDPLPLDADELRTAIADACAAEMVVA